MLGDPLLHFDTQPEGINTDRDHSKEKPLNIIAKQLPTRTVKAKLMAINGRMLYIPRLLQADRPGSADAECTQDDQGL